MNEPGDPRGEGTVARVPRPAAGKAAAALLGATLATWAAALVDAHFANGASPAPGAKLSLLFSDAGVLAPLGLVLGAGAFVASLVLDLEGLVAAFRSDLDRNGARGAAYAAGIVGAFGALVLLAHVARAVLAMDVPAKGAGASLALAAVALAAFVLGAARAALRFAEARGVTSSPKVWVIGAATSVVALGAYGVLRGGPNGDQGPLGVLGVLAREELDLRAPALALFVALGAVGLPFVSRRVPAWAAALAATAALGLTARAAGAPLDERAVAMSIQRGAPLGGIGLALLRRITDRDRDGASARFGGGDCDDGDPGRRPGADDVPGNGVDEDCSGADDAPMIVAPPPIPAPATAQSDAAWLSARFPAGLSVVLVTVDTLRADLGYAGNPRPLSPNIDALAKESVVFERAYSLASYTGKSVGPMLLGKYPSETSRTFDHFDRFGKDETFIQERLAAAGVRTLSAQGHWYFRPDTGLGRGFAELDLGASPRVPQVEGDKTVNSAALTDAALALLAKPENVAGRFFLWVHYLDPHAMYVPHAEFDFGRSGRDLYDAEVAFTDRHIGRLISAIEEAPYAARTAIVLTSDHGEAFGEHGLLRHGREVWEELVRVPLVVRVPGVPPRRVSARRSAIDLVPTLLDFYGLPRPDDASPGFVSGRSLVPDLRGTDRPEARPVLVDMSEGPYNEERQAFIDGDLKIIASNGRPLGLYDLAKDPEERRDLLGDPAASAGVVARFKAFRRTLRVKPPRR